MQNQRMPKHISLFPGRKEENRVKNGGMGLKKI
jgi:hypothetical protein